MQFCGIGVILTIMCDFVLYKQKYVVAEYSAGKFPAG